jgi:hypothetical protein
MKSYLGRTDLPRGIRNNNAGNIRLNPNNRWKGKIQSTDPAFEQFATYAYGIRAAMVLVGSYVRKGVNTVGSIISRWAPSSENNTRAYISYVTRKTGFSENKVINPNDPNHMYPLLDAIIKQENGEQWRLSKADFNEAWQLLGSNTANIIATPNNEPQQASMPLATSALIAFIAFSSLSNGNKPTRKKSQGTS